MFGEASYFLRSRQVSNGKLVNKRCVSKPAVDDEADKPTLPVRRRTLQPTRAGKLGEHSRIGALWHFQEGSAASNSVNMALIVADGVHLYAISTQNYNSVKQLLRPLYLLAVMAYRYPF